MTAGPAPSGYRPCVGLTLFNRDGLVFAGLRRDMATAAWQMPQGGIDSGETARTAAFRELAEEVGTDKAEIVAESTGWTTYELPESVRGRIWKGRYVGQAQRWFLLRFIGRDRDIDIEASHHAEFADWRWMALDELVRVIVPFKRPVYERIAAEFGPLIADAIAAEAGGG